MGERKVIMYCKKCGRAVEEDSLYCNNCGAQINTTQNQNISEDSSSFGFALLGFFIPLVGLILFSYTRGRSPKEQNLLVKVL